MVSENELEKFLQSVIFLDLEKGRPGWDKPHTESVVQYLKDIIDNSPEFKVDRQVLLIAAYAHDWGYAGLFKDGQPLQLDDVSAAKKLHMKLGAGKLEKLLQDKFFDFLPKEQKDRTWFECMTKKIY